MSINTKNRIRHSEGIIKMNEKYLKQNSPGNKDSLGHMLKKNKQINVTIKKAATDLTLVNDVLDQGNVPVEMMEQALTQNKDVEQKIDSAADDLKGVNSQLSKEIAGRKGLESELADMKTDLADVRDDLSEAQAEAATANKNALLDALTGLPNRTAFKQGLERGVMQAKRHDWKLAVLFIDVDDFKIINDAHGHGMGDQVLQTVATRLQSLFRSEDMVCRWGGDEFVCLLLEIQQEADVLSLAERLITRIAEPCEFDGTAFSIALSVGMAIYPADGETADILLKNADSAMYKAKGTENRVVRF